MFLVGAGDFSPSSLEFSGLKSRAPKDLRPRQISIFGGLTRFFFNLASPASYLQVP